MLKNLLLRIPPDSRQIDCVTYSNLLQTLSADVHPNNRNEKVSKEFLAMDQEVFSIILENIFVGLN